MHLRKLTPLCSLAVLFALQPTLSFADTLPRDNEARQVQAVEAASLRDISIQPGQCWVYSQIKARPIEDVQTITVKESRTSIKVTPAEMRQGYKTVVTREGTVSYRVTPPTYKQIEEQVLIRPEVTNFVNVPAVYEKREKEVIVEDAYTAFERCGAAGVNFGTNNVAVAFCAKEVPAKSETVIVEELIQPEQTKVEIIPAEYKVIKKWVVDKPAQVTEVTLNEQSDGLPIEELVSQAKTDQVDVPSITRIMPRKSFTGEPKVVLRQAVCDSEITPELVTEVQTRLEREGYTVGGVDGLLGKRTVDALSTYQVDQGLASGALTIESLTSLGVAGY